MNNNKVKSLKDLELFIDNWFESNVPTLSEDVFSEFKLYTDQDVYQSSVMLIKKLKYYYENDVNFIHKICDIIVRMCHSCNQDNYKVFSLVLSTMYKDEHFAPTLKYMLKEVIPNNNCKIEKILPIFTGLSRMYTSITSENVQLHEFIEYHEQFVNDTIESFIEQILIDYISHCDSKLIRKDLIACEKNEYVKALIEKVDELIYFLCTFLKDFCFDGINYKKEKLVKVFKILTDIFYRKMLHYNLCDSMFHTHFVFSYFISLHKDLSLSFCNYLMKILLDKHEKRVNRSRAAINLAGFVSKFNYLQCDVIYRMIDIMFDWCQKYVCSVKMLTTRYEQHQHFYSIFNSALIIFMYRYSDIIDHRGEGNLVFDSVKWKLDFIINHRLNPLQEFPLREKFNELITLFEEAHMGDLQAILSVNNDFYKQPLQITSMPCMYFFLHKSKHLFESLKFQPR